MATTANGYQQHEPWWKDILYIIVGAIIIAWLFSLQSCNSTKLAKSQHEVKTDSVSEVVSDSSDVIISQKSDNKAKDSVRVDNYNSGSDLQIDFGDTTAGGYLPVTIIQTDTTLVINPGGRIIKHITDRKIQSKHDSTAVQKHDSSSVVKHDSTVVRENQTTDLKKDTEDKTKNKQSSRVPIMAFVMLAVFLILCLVIIHYWSKIEAFFKL